MSMPAIDCSIHAGPATGTHEKEPQQPQRQQQQQVAPRTQQQLQLAKRIAALRSNVVSTNELGSLLRSLAAGQHTELADALLQALMPGPLSMYSLVPNDGGMYGYLADWADQPITALVFMCAKWTSGPWATVTKKYFTRVLEVRICMLPVDHVWCAALILQVPVSADSV